MFGILLRQTEFPSRPKPISLIRATADLRTRTAAPSNMVYCGCATNEGQESPGPPRMFRVGNDASVRSASRERTEKFESSLELSRGRASAELRRACGLARPW